MKHGKCIWQGQSQVYRSPELILYYIRHPKALESFALLPPSPVSALIYARDFVYAHFQRDMECKSMEVRGKLNNPWKTQQILKSPWETRVTLESSKPKRRRNRHRKSRGADKRILCMTFHGQITSNGSFKFLTTQDRAARFLRVNCHDFSAIGRN